MYLERRRKYIGKSGKTSLDLVDVLPKKLTVDRHYVHHKTDYDMRWGQRFTNDTLFNEAKVLPPGIDIAEKDLDARGTRTIEDVLRVYTDIVERDWPSDRLHVVMHSSGYDSRLLSAVIRKLFRKNGLDWLGGVLFLNIKWEASEFKRIMQFEGWAPRQCRVWNENVGEDEYYARPLADFAGAWKRLGGVARIPVNMFWDPIEDLQHRGVLPPPGKPMMWHALGAQFVLRDLDLWHAQYSNTVIDFLCRGGTKPFNDTWNMFYYHNIRIRPFRCSAEFTPWLHRDLIRVVGGLAKGDTGTDRESTIFRKRLCDMVMPGLSKFRNIHALGDERRRISARLSSGVREAYRRSWYGRHVAPGVEGNEKHYSTNFSDWWEHWTSASLCEHLRSRGYEIEV